MAQSTKTYLEIVNDAIDESGSDLTTFRVDGSDFTTNTDAMMNRFKKWVKRAWLDIQQDATDWHWLDSTAMVNISPGIMFYSDHPIGFATAAINPASIVDVDGSTQISDLEVSQVVHVDSGTNSVSSKRYLGYMDLMYDDYSYTNQHVLDFGLKAGGERLTREGNGRVKFTASFALNSATFAAGAKVRAGDTVVSIIADKNNGAATTTCVITDGVVTAISQENSITYLEVAYTSMDNDFWTVMQGYAATATSDFNLQWDINISSATEGPLVLSGGIRYLDVGDNFIFSGAISPLEYSIEYNTNVITGASITGLQPIAFTQYSIVTNGGTDIDNYTAPVEYTIEQLYEDSTDGIARFKVSQESGLAPNTDGASSIVAMLWSTMLISMSTLTQHTFRGIIEYTAEGYVDSAFNLAYAIVIAINDGESPVGTSTYTYQIAYNLLNYVHSWKSYNWEEETQVDDFVLNIRSINQNSCRLIKHEDPSPPGELPLTYVPWGAFENKYDFASSIPSMPRMISQDSTGRWRFYPPVDKPYTITFDYMRSSQELEDYNDVPIGMPNEFVDMIMWKALCYYGEFDEQPAVAARANKNYKNILLTIQSSLRNPFYMRPKKLY